MKIIKKVKWNRKVRVLIVGAGEAGRIITNEIKRHPSLGYIPAGFVDDDPAKLRKKINGLPVLGGISDISSIASRQGVNEVLIAIPSAAGSVIRNIVGHCEKANLPFKIVPGVFEILSGDSDAMPIREVRMEDLLKRPSVSLDLNEIKDFLKSKSILITGAGGSIGSELARQILQFSPKKLIIMGHGENSIYKLQMELAKEKSVKIIIGDIRDRAKCENVIRTEKPGIIFHAAAHKHVPLMEANPDEAVKNNVLGTLNMAIAADRFGVREFVLISSDKAVNPTSVMGATKRIAEMIIQGLSFRSKTKFVAGRFGNVLASRGSVIPLFMKQIEEGGPVTVTHPEMVRFFMTIPEAAQLVIQAGAFAKGGEIFILDMGEPVKIVELAKDLIKLSGLKPGKDIKIAYTGIRPGEKLYEEILSDIEGLKATQNRRIFITKPEKADFNRLLKNIGALIKVADCGDGRKVIETIKKLVPEYSKAAGKAPR